MNAMAIIFALLAVAVRIDAHGDPSAYTLISAFLFAVAMVIAVVGAVLEYKAGKP